jgi:hypothetical protein
MSILNTHIMIQEKTYTLSEMREWTDQLIETTANERFSTVVLTIK